MTQPARTDGNKCFACGPDNPVGLRIGFSFVDGICTGSFVPLEHHVGYEDMTHGGLIFTALDDVMANWLYLQGLRGHTARAEIRFRSALPVGTEIQLRGDLVEKRRRLIKLRGQAIRADNGELVAETTASFMLDGN